METLCDLWLDEAMNKTRTTDNHTPSFLPARDFADFAKAAAAAGAWTTDQPR